MRWTPMATQSSTSAVPSAISSKLGMGKTFRFDRERVACHDSIDYRRSTMKIDRASAQTYARWFQALADANRVVICNLLADAGRPMTVGEIVEAVDIGQSTVSHHLKLLAEVGFVQGPACGHQRRPARTQVPAVAATGQTWPAAARSPAQRRSAA